MITYNKDAIKSLRQSLNMNQAEFADKLNAANKGSKFRGQHVCAWEAGKAKPSMDSIIAIVNTFACSLDLFFRKV